MTKVLSLPHLVARILLVSVVTAGVLVSVTSPASADVIGLEIVSATSASDSDDYNSVTATCPAGKRLLGTGYQINGALGEAVVDDFRPNGDTSTAPTAVTVGAYEAEPYAGNWTVTAFAVCANLLSGLVRVSAVSASNSLDYKNTTATCPAGKQLLGGGFEVNGGAGEVIVDDFTPDGDEDTAPTSVLAGAYEAEDYATNWTVTAYGICANPVPGLVRIELTELGSSDDSHSVTAQCSAGKLLVGTGFEMNSALGEAVVDDLVPTSTSVTAIAYEEDAYANNWLLTTYAICVSSLSRIPHTSDFDSNDFRTVTATCHDDKQVTGGGFTTFGSEGEAVVNDLLPNGNETTAPTDMTASAYETDGFADSWNVTVFAICTVAMPGLVRVSATSAEDSSDLHTVTATCPAGKQLVGTGYAITGGLGEVIPDDLAPNGNATTAPTAVTVTAYEAEAYAGNWSVTAHAICANPVPGLVRVSAMSANDSSALHQATASCPAGKQMLGTGFEIVGATGEAVISDLTPNGSDSQPPSNVFVAAFEEDPYAGNWFLHAYAICAYA